MAAFNFDKGRDELWLDAFYLHLLKRGVQTCAKTVDVGIQSDVRSKNDYRKCMRTQKNLKPMTK